MGDGETNQTLVLILSDEFGIVVRKEQQLQVKQFLGGGFRELLLYALWQPISSLLVAACQPSLFGP